jgi:hypothetical protein
LLVEIFALQADSFEKTLKLIIEFKNAPPSGLEIAKIQKI